MRSLHRFIAAFLLAIFIPATVMAGAVRLCLGPNGHANMEFAHVPHHQSAVAQSESAPFDSALETVVVEAGHSCVDLALVATASQTASVTAGVDRHAADGAVLAILTPSHTIASLRHECSVAQTTERTGATGNRALADLRTIVLLI